MMMYYVDRETSRGILDGAIPSREMREFLLQRPMCPHVLRQIIAGSPVGLWEKLRLFSILLQGENHEKERAFDRACLRRIDQALAALRAAPTEFFLLEEWWYDSDCKAAEHGAVGPIRSFEQIIQYICEDNTLQTFDDMNPDVGSCCWYTAEKWAIDPEGDGMSHQITYTLIGDQVCYFEWPHELEVSQVSEYPHIPSFALREVPALNLPVPFKAGDIVQIDSRPFAPIVRGVVTEVGDNCDCCCVRFLSKSGNQYAIQALKHGHIMPQFTSLLSPLYGISKFEGSLPRGESVFGEVSRYIRGEEVKGRRLETQLFSQGQTLRKVDLEAYLRK